jgi:hypothetical protein
MRLALLPSIVIALHCQAQSPADLFSKAPPAVEEALRATVSKFYQSYVDGKFRAATQYVAEDSQDVFFEADKRRCHSFEIIRIDYLENFTKANVVIKCPTEVLMPPKGLTRVTMPLASKWKVEQEKWVWYVPPRLSRESAFGTFKPGEGTADDLTIPQGPTVEELMKMISLDRNSVKLKVGDKAQEKLVLTNGTTGVLKILVDQLPPDLKVTLSPAELKAKETSTITIEYEPRDDKPRTAVMREEIRLIAEPMHRLLPVAISFDK